MACLAETSASGIGTSRFLVTANKRATALATARAFEAVISLARRPPLSGFVRTGSACSSVGTSAAMASVAC
jgi:hypothetical protein